MSNSVERVRAALPAAGHADTITMFPDGTRTAQDAANAVGCAVAQIAKSIVLRAGEQVVLVHRLRRQSRRCRQDRGAAGPAGEIGRRPLGARRHRLCHRRRGAGRPRLAPRIFIDAELMALDPVWAAAGSPRHVFRTSAAELVRMTGGEVADVKEGA